MDENLNQQNWGSAGNNGRPMPPPPPPPEITLRTMQSDIESIKQSGGENPIAKPFIPPEIKNQTNNMELGDLSKEEGMIKPGNGDGVLPPSEPPKKKLKIFILISVLILVVAGAVFAGYKFIYPMFKPVIPVAPPQEQLAVIPENIPIITEEPIIPESSIPESSLPTPEVVPPVEELATTTPEVIPETIPVPPPVVLKQHVSLLVSPADLSAPLILTASTSLISIKELLIAEAAKNRKRQRH